jgi:Pyruvate/2-oxoacid:ferredoxin oxidoreductase delta subunit
MVTDKRYSSLIVYYFSGTGNARNVAAWLCEAAARKHVPGRMVNIADVDRRKIEVPDPDALLAFVSPVHGFNYPPIMVHFLYHFPKGRNDVLLLNTRAGMKIGSVVTPGLSGATFFLASLLLKVKGYAINAWYPINLPSNWMSLHPSLNTRTVDFLYAKYRPKVEALAACVLDGGKNYKGLIEIVQDVIIAPVSLGYYLVGRFFFAKSFYASRACDDCGVCMKGCPVQAIREIDGRPFWTFSCESCMKCMSMCPKKAIETAHGFIGVQLVLFYAVLVGLLYTVVPAGSGIARDTLAGFIAETLLMLGSLGILYHVLHRLLRTPAIERMIVFTSLTSYRFWGGKYRAPRS